MKRAKFCIVLNQAVLAGDSAHRACAAELTQQLSLAKISGGGWGTGCVCSIRDSEIVDLGPKSGRKSNVWDLLTAEFERADLNWHTKGAFAECNLWCMLQQLIASLWLISSEEAKF